MRSFSIVSNFVLCVFFILIFLFLFYFILSSSSSLSFLTAGSNFRFILLGLKNYDYKFILDCATVLLCHDFLILYMVPFLCTFYSTTILYGIHSLLLMCAIGILIRTRVMFSFVTFIYYTEPYVISDDVYRTLRDPLLIFVSRLFYS